MGYPVQNLGALGQTPAECPPLPTPGEALYRHPNTDGTPKACRNCMMYVPSENRCVIHDRGLEVTEDLICGYHIFGVPMEKWMEHPGMEALTPDLSGLRNAGSGLVCANCRFFEDLGNGKGNCSGVADPNTGQPPASVELMGFCARHKSF